VTDLRSLPTDRILAALADPRNAHAQTALRAALAAKGHQDTPEPAKAPQHVTSVAGGYRTEDGGLLVTLPLPPSALSPNARVHWRKKADAVKEYRAAAKVAARLALWRDVAPRWDRATVQATFYLRRRRNLDGDNALAWIKAGIDGLADAGVVANDSGFTHLPVRVEIDRERPRVELLVTPLARVGAAMYTVPCGG
jgi:crossover junction endodeoxyribonuclease RusA